MSTSDMFIQLIEREDVMEVVWSLLNAIWKPEDDIAEYFRKGEENINEVERTLNHTFFEIYEVLHEKSNKRRTNLKLPSIVMDGLSVREGSLIKEILKTKGYKILDYTYTFSPLPSVTEEFSKRIFNVSNPSAIKGDFCYQRVLYGKIPFTSLDKEKTLVWVNYPDYLLHHAGKIIPPEESFERTSSTLLEVLQRLETDTVTITSDHGYIFLDRVWPVSETDGKFLRSIFGAERFAFIPEIQDEKMKKLRKIPKELGWILECDSFCLIKGRYAYPMGGGRLVAHGGISLMECIVPSIEVEL